MTDESTSDTKHEEYWVRHPETPDQRKVYIRIINRERAEIIGEGDEEPEQISIYQVWQTDRESGLSPTVNAQTPWGQQSRQPGADRSEGGDAR